MKTRVYLDNCCFNRPFDDPLTPLVQLEIDAKLHIQKQIRGGDIELAWSYILEYENSANPYENQKESIARWKRLAIVDVNESAEVIELASSIIGLGIRNKDALHIACAIAAQCRYFLTTDKKILNKRVSGVLVRNPLAYVREAEGGA